MSNRGEFPYEVLASIIASADLKTKMNFLSVNKELSREAKRNLKYRGTKTGKTRTVRVEDKGNTIVTTYRIENGINNGREYLTTIQYFDKTGKLHREGGPAEISFYYNGRKSYEKWYKNGQLASMIFWYADAEQKHEETWFNSRGWHRKNAPAIIRWYENGDKQYEGWFKNGRRYRKNGPSETFWKPDGDLVESFIDDRDREEDLVFETD